MVHASVCGTERIAIHWIMECRLSLSFLITAHRQRFQ
jgi:hypothetical protein